MPPTHADESILSSDHLLSMPGLPVAGIIVSSKRLYSGETTTLTNETTHTYPTVG